MREQSVEPRVVGRTGDSTLNATALMASSAMLRLLRKRVIWSVVAPSGKCIVIKVWAGLDH